MTRNYLQEYIDSGGENIPPDTPLFSQTSHPPSHFADLCVLCGEDHDELRFNQYDKSGNAVQVDAAICRNCFRAIHASTKMEISYNIFDRVRQIKTLSFDSEVYKWYRHLNPKRDLYVKNDECYKCYVCRKKIEETAITAPVPVEHSNVLNGGRVIICEECQPKVANYSAEPDESRLLEQVKCSQCNLSYFINRLEANYRITLKYNNKAFSCPECAHKTIFIYHNNRIWLDELKQDREKIPSRFLEKTCACCGNKFSMDLTLSVDTLIDTHEVTGSTLVCQKCSENGARIFLREGIRVSERLVFLLSETEEAGIFKFECYKLPDASNSAKHVLTSHVEALSMIDAVFIAHDEIIKLVIGKQTEIWG